jgi:hypothetical protein
MPSKGTPLNSPTVPKIRWASFWLVLIGLLSGQAHADLKGYSIEITFDNFSGRGTLSDFPALVKLTTTSTNGYNGFLDPTNGYDLRFWDGAAFSGNELDYEIEDFDSSGNSLLWVRMPQLTHNSSIHATWGDAAYNSQESYTTNGNVWSSEFKGVWHLGEADSMAEDATSNAHDADGTNGTPISSTGQIGLGTDFNDGTNDLISVPASSDFDIGTNFTVSAWIYNRNPTLGEAGIAGTHSSGWIFGFENAASFDYLRVYDGGWRSSGNAIAASTWTHVTYTFENNVPTDGTDGRFHIDGVFVGAADCQARVAAAKLHIGEGGPGWPGRNFEGVIDELRIENTTRSVDWIWACYMNQGANHGSFVNYGGIVLIETQVTSIDINASTTVPLVATDYSADITFNGNGAANVMIDFSAFGTGAGNGMDLSTCSTDSNDYLFTGFSISPDGVIVDNSNKTIAFTGGNVAAGQITIDNSILGVGWRMTNATAGTNSVNVMIGSSSNTFNLTLEPDITSPTLVSMSDDQSGGPAINNSVIIYTVTFSEGMDASTVTSSIFENATGNATISVGTPTTSSNISFTVPVTPTSNGNLQLQIKAASGVTDESGNPLNTTPGRTDDTVLEVWTPPARSSTYSMQITFNNLSGIGTLNHFPALVKLNTTNTNNYEGFVDTTDGYDLRFWDTATFTGNQLSYETEVFDNSGNSFVWVRVPSFSNNLSIWATWGDDAYNSQETYTTNGNVWESDLKGVWHLGESDNMSQDSTANSHHADAVLNTPLSTLGLIGKGTDFDHDDNDYITVPNSTDFDIGTNFTISAWVSYRDPLASSEDSIAGTYSVGWIFGWENSGSWDELRMYNNTTGWLASGSTTSANTWTYVAYTFENSFPTDATDGKFYHDGVLTGSSDGEAITSTQKLHIGAGGPNKVTACFDGIIDELRIEATSRTSEWIEACYKTQGPSHTSYVEYGNVQTPPKPRGTIIMIE